MKKVTVLAVLVIALAFPAAAQVKIGGEVQTGAAQPDTLAIGKLRTATVSPDGALFTRPFGAVPFTCSLDNIGATLTQCQAAPAPSGLKLYITDVAIQSTTATAGQFIIRYGTGTDCGSGTTSLFPSGATVVRFGYPGNAVPPAVVTPTTPIITPANKAVCVLCVATNTCTLQINGYTAP